MLGQSSWFKLPETRTISSSQGRVKSSKIKVPVPTALWLKTALLLPLSPSLCSEEEVSPGSSEPTEATTSSWWYQPALKAQPHLRKASLAKCQKGPEIRFGCKQGEVWKEARPCQQSKALGAQHWRRQHRPALSSTQALTIPSQRSSPGGCNRHQQHLHSSCFSQHSQKHQLSLSPVMSCSSLALLSCWENT